MSTIRLRIGMLGCAWMIAAGCTSEDGEGMGDTQGADGSSGTSGADSTMSTTMNAEDTLDPHTSGESDTGTSELGTSSGGEATGNHDGSETGSDVEFDEEFEWVAEFLRTNCVACHSTNANGSLVLESADISNEDVQLALEGVVANTGLLLVEPFDRQASQTYLQITNEFGAQFPVEDTDRFGAWIDAGALYLAQ